MVSVTESVVENCCSVWIVIWPLECCLLKKQIHAALGLSLQVFCSPDMAAGFLSRFLRVMLHSFYPLTLLHHDAINTRLCIAFSLLVKKLDFDVIPLQSLRLLPCAFGQMQAEMSRDFSTVAFSLPVGHEARNAPKQQL